jgi:hypothetical protein
VAGGKLLLLSLSSLAKSISAAAVPTAAFIAAAAAGN